VNVLISLLANANATMQVSKLHRDALNNNLATLLYCL